MTYVHTPVTEVSILPIYIPVTILVLSDSLIIDQLGHTPLNIPRYTADFDHKAWSQCAHSLTEFYTSSNRFTLKLTVEI